MKFTILHLVGVLLVGIVVGILINRTRSEGFDGSTSCGNCNRPHPCGCDRPDPRPLCPSCPPCREPDMSKYVLKTTIPPCPPVPDMRNYILKTEVPPVPDLSNYVLKSSIPKPQPVLLDCSKCNKPKGECPPCPRPRCPEVKCAPPTKCPACSPCPRPTCPPAGVQCKAEEPVDGVRPFLAPLSYRGFGMD